MQFLGNRTTCAIYSNCSSLEMRPNGQSDSNNDINTHLTLVHKRVSCVPWHFGVVGEKLRTHIFTEYIHVKDNSGVRFWHQHEKEKPLTQ